MHKKIKSALISVFNKDGLITIVSALHKSEVIIYSTGGTEQFITSLGIPCILIEHLTGFPSILGGRVKTLHPLVFGGILARRDLPVDVNEMHQYNIPEIDLVIVDLYPFEETLASFQKVSHTGGNLEEAVIEKIDIGGPSMIRAAAKNFKDVLVVADKADYFVVEKILFDQDFQTTIEQRKQFAAKAFEVVMNYDIAISNYFNGHEQIPKINFSVQNQLRYGENPHQKATFYGNVNDTFSQLHGKELSYNNLVDADAAIQLMREFPAYNEGGQEEATFAIIKHTNVCGISQRQGILEAWQNALAADSESAFGGVLICNSTIDKPAAEAINQIFFEVLIADKFDEDALEILRSKKNRILLTLASKKTDLKQQIKTISDGFLSQQKDEGNYAEWKETGGRETTASEKENLKFANIVCKHLKSNAIALVRNKQLIGKGCGQTSRIDALRQAIAKANQFHFDLHGAVLASDAFFPFNDCVQIAHAAGIEAFIQPGGSVRDKDSIDYCVQNNLAMVLTGMRHFRH